MKTRVWWAKIILLSTPLVLIAAAWLAMVAHGLWLWWTFK